MKPVVIVLLLALAPVLAQSQSLVTSIQVVPENPEPDTPFQVYVTVSLPDRCWLEPDEATWQGTLGVREFTLEDTYAGEACSGGLFLFGMLFDQEGLPEGQHLITIFEHHDSIRDPESYPHLLEFIVGDPAVAETEATLDAVKARFR